MRSVVVGGAIGVMITLATLASGSAGVFYHVQCAIGSPVSSETLWTPFSLTNAPYLGSTVYHAHFATWGLLGWTNVTVGPGLLAGGNLSTGYFETQNWTVYAESNRSVFGPGFSRPCGASFVALMAHTSLDVSSNGSPLQGPGNTSNANEPTTFICTSCAPGPKIQSATFANGFSQFNLASISTCGTAGKEVNYSSSSFEVSLPVPTTLGPSAVPTTILSAESFTYFFPANGGTWSVDDLGHIAGLHGPGLSFSWQRC